MSTAVELNTFSGESVGDCGEKFWLEAENGECNEAGAERFRQAVHFFHAIDVLDDSMQVIAQLLCEF